MSDIETLRLRALAKAKADRERMSAWEAERMTHAPTDDPRAALPPSIPPRNLSEETLTPMQAFQAGRARGNPREIEAELGGTVTSDRLGNFYWTPEGETQPRAVNPPGFDWMDIPRTLGEELPQTAGGAAGAALGRTPAGMAVKAAFGAAGGVGLSEAEQTVRGVQRDPLGAVGARMGQSAALEGTMAGAGILASRMFPGGPLSPGSEYAKDQLQRAIRFAEEGPPNAYPNPLAADILGQTGAAGGMIPGPVAQTAANQVAAATGRLTDLRTDMAAQAAQALEQEFLMPPQAKTAAREALSRAAGRAREGVRQETRQAGPGMEAGSYRAAEGAKAAGEAARARVSAEYRGPLADALRAEEPVFDLGPAQAQWKRQTLDQTVLRDTGVLGPDGRPIMDQVVEQVELIPEATGKIRYLKTALAALDPKQTNFEAIKRTRSEVGRLLGDRSFRDQAEAPARRLYGELTEVLKNPINDAPEYLKAFENANLLEQWRLGMMSDDSVERVLKSKGGSGLISEMAADPESFVTPEFRRFMDLAPANDLGMMREAVRQSILSGDDPAAAISRMNPAGGGEGYRYLFKDEAERQAFEQQARRVTEFNVSPMGQMFKEELKKNDTLKYAIGQLENREQAQVLWDGLDPAGRERMQQALVDDVVDRAYGFDEKTGLPRISTRALDTRIRELKRNGIWSYLGPEQRGRLEDLPAYYRVVVNKGRDVGTSLETASMVADLKGVMTPWHPSEFARGLTAFQNMMHQRLLAGYITNPKRANRLMQRVKKMPRNEKSWAMGTILTAPVLWSTFEEMSGREG